MKSVTIFAMGHKIVKINDEAIKMDIIDEESPTSYGSVTHSGCSIIIEKVQDKQLKKELEDLQKHLKKQNKFDTILACVNKERK